MPEKKQIAMITVFIVAIGLSVLSIVFFNYIYDDTEPVQTAQPTPTRKYIIFMISDGFGPASETFARYMNPNKTNLPLDDMLVGHVKTYTSQNLIADSASGATSYSCGIKTYNEAIAVDDNYKACGTTMEAAKIHGYLTGVIVTSRVTHATPAAFTAHVIDRDSEEEIAFQQANNQSLDIMLGGGLSNFDVEYKGQNLLHTLENRGYQYISDLYQLENEELRTPLVGLFASGHLMYAIDRRNEAQPTQPSLPQMVQKGLDLLKKTCEENDTCPGFFVMIEGSRIDMAAHDNDAMTHYLEIVEYQESIEIVRDFADKNSNEQAQTYVISVSDHATGGLTLGRRADNGTYPEYQWFPDRVAMQNASVEVMSNAIKANPTAEVIAETLMTNCNITATQSEIDLIIWSYNTGESGIFKATIGDVIGKRANIGWTTAGHTGEDVNLYAYGSRIDGVSGIIENSFLGQTFAKQFGLQDTMESITESLSDLTMPKEAPSSKKTHHHAYGSHN